MRDAGLLVIVPSRGRPRSPEYVSAAWRETSAYDDASLTFVIDADDPRHAGYFEHDFPPIGQSQVNFAILSEWHPLVPKINTAAYAAARTGLNGGEAWGGIAFMGDDHLPRTPGWPAKILDALKEMGTGIVYGRDGFQDENLPTWWAMTPDIIRTFGAMVPAEVEHLYCDNVIKDLGIMAECLRYLPEVLIEHMHPMAGKALADEGYVRVNSIRQNQRDRQAYFAWRHDHLAKQAEQLRELKEARRG